jgi:hypothetical protein
MALDIVVAGGAEGPAAMALDIVVDSAVLAVALDVVLIGPMAVAFRLDGSRLAVRHDRFSCRVPGAGSTLSGLILRVVARSVQRVV